MTENVYPFMTIIYGIVLSRIGTVLSGTVDFVDGIEQYAPTEQEDGEEEGERAELGRNVCLQPLGLPGFKASTRLLPSL
jgi:hypothetical protein